jgi:DNA polymerase-1
MTTPSQTKKPILIIDGYGFIFRAYHVQPPLTSPAGIPVGAIYGFTSMLLKVINEFKPEHAVIVLDHSGKNFRHDLYKEYKANRPPAPDDLVVQLKLVEKAAKALNFTCLSKQGFEADDIIATLAKKANEIKKDALIISSDKDLMQLINEHVKMYDPMKSKYIEEEDILKKFGVGADKVRHVQALMGDSSDNIPGVAGIGPKTASQLVNEFGNLDRIFTSLDQIKSARQRELLEMHKENALISWQLVGLDDDVDVDRDIENFHWRAPEISQISDFLNEYGFKSLHKRIENLFDIKIQAQASGGSVGGSSEKSATDSVKKTSAPIKIEKQEQLSEVIAKIKADGIVAVSTDSDGNIVLSDTRGLYIISYEKNHGQVSGGDLFSYQNAQKLAANFNQQLQDLFGDKAVKKITYNLKSLLRFCKAPMRAFDDLQIMEYVTSAGTRQREEVPKITEFLDLYNDLKAKLIEHKSLHLYQDIDLPLCYILHKMEQEGVKIDPVQLSKLSTKFAEQIAQLEQDIFKIAGAEFNLASPKQLGEILFDKMKFPFAKKTGKTESYSTNVVVLEKLQEEGFEIAALLLKHRHLAKLKNTYTDTLPKQADPRTNRVHTTFLQTVTSTGRLSSIAPNVQNIPTRTEEGSSIRSAFVAKEGAKLISADYSQIELRILSHVANIESLKQAFLLGRDIHAQTASQIFDLPLEQMTPELRYKAKAINFGIIYGISAFGLAKQLNISRKEASDYIAKYFEEYPGIQKYMKDIVDFAKEHGFVQNVLGRKCFIPTIQDKNHALRAFGERAAINAPMQSLASDIVKMAMISLDKELEQKKMRTKMILQIHDELIFEAPGSEVDEVSKLIKLVMENILKLDVTLKVSVNAGDNWQVIH